MSITDIVIPFPAEASWRLKRSPVVRQIRPGQLATRLRDMIAAGELRPGGPVTLQSLSAQFGVSRSSLREAVRLLVAERRGEPLPRRGAVAEPITAAKIDEIVPIIGALEAVAGQFACARISSAELLDLEALHQRLALHFHQGDACAYMQTADAIWQAVFTIAGNDSLSMMHAMLLRQVGWSRVADQAPAEWDAAAQEHELMLRALQVGNEDLWTLVASRHHRHRAALLRRHASERNGMPSEAARGRLQAGWSRGRARAPKRSGIVQWLNAWLNDPAPR